MRTCTIDGCDKIHRAKGLCNTHYGQQNPKRYLMEERTCDACGKTFSRVKRADRYASVTCGLECRDMLRASMKCDLPSDHWALMFGATSEWVAPKRATVTEYNCEWCGKEATRTQSQAKYCTLACKKRSHKQRRRAAEFNAVGQYTWADITRLWLAFDKACAYCATPTALTDIQAEHVTALSVGGANNLSNLLPSCGPCNSDKRQLTLTAWAADRVRRHLSPVKTTWDQADARYSHLALEGQLEAA